MSKLPSNLDNPLDRLLVAGVEMISEPLHRMGVTPNMLTAASLVAGVSSAYALNERKYELAALLTAIAYFLDCADGHMARKYKQVTVFGVWFVHCSDIFKVIALLGVMF